MKPFTKILLLAIALVFTTALNAQILKPVSWSYGFKKTSATEAVVFFRATIDEGWHLYSQFVKPGGPIKTTFSFPASKDYTLNGSTIEPKPITRMEKVFGMDVSYFEKSVIFQQKIKLKKGQVNFKGALEYMVCNDKQCLPPDTQEFSIDIK